MKDYLDYASEAFDNVDLNFRTVAYPTAADALEALKNGEIDCMFPCNLTEYDAESMDLVITPPLMTTEMDAVVRASEQKEFIKKEQVTVAVNQGNTNYDLYLEDHYPDWQRAYFKDTPTGLKAVAEGKADCVIISNYRYSNISKQCEKLKLTTIYTGVEMEYYMAVCKGDIQLYSILARVTGFIPESVVHTALTYYSTEDMKSSFWDLIKENLVVVLVVIAVILLQHSFLAEKKVREDKNLIKTLKNRVMTDSLTSVRNKGAFTDSIQTIQKRLDAGGEMEFAIGIFDCDDLKMINDRHGHDKGDTYLVNACKLICNVFQHSQVFRICGDEFGVIMLNEDYDDREALVGVFKDRSIEICASVKNKWEEVSVALGIAAYAPKLDHSAEDVAKRADELMYEDKRSKKLEK